MPEELSTVPAAVILGCVDSRVPAEIVFDVGIGDIFTGRVAGNVVNARTAPQAVQNPSNLICIMVEEEEDAFEPINTSHHRNSSAGVS